MTSGLKYHILLILVVCWGTAGAQQFLTAGPDKEACEGKGVQIGPPDVNPDLCYLWEPAVGLSCANCPNPIATVNSDTEYTLHITNDDFSLSFSDNMLVEIVFGNITFDAQYVKQGSTEKVTATLNRYEGGSVTWEFEGDDIGCTINPVPGMPHKAEITPGDRFGKLTVVAILDADEDCKARATIDVNAGVKDIEVAQVANPGRIARSGETLHILNSASNLVKATAIPNEGFPFEQPTPKWHTPHVNSVVLPDGTITHEEDVNLVVGAAFTAGYGAPEYEPTTQVEVHLPMEIPIPIAQILQAFNDKINGPLKDKGKFKNSPLQLSFGVELFNTELKSSLVEKYHSPELEYKWEVDLVSKVTASGTICHPVLCKTIALPEILGGDTLVTTEVSLTCSGELSIAGGWERDPGQEDDSWKLKSALEVQTTLKLNVTIGGSFNFGGYTLIGGAEPSASAGTTLSWDAANPEFITAKNFVNPLKFEINLYLRNNVDPKKSIPLIPKQEYELVPKFESEPFNFISLSTLFN